MGKRAIASSRDDLDAARGVGHGDRLAVIDRIARGLDW